MTTKDEMVALLLKRGWKEEETASPWRWYQPALPAAHYRLEDAWELERGRKR